ncbi:MAG TPA: aminotransferase class III-fold pyridoxal phosphate-dependent enzyme [Chloroflexia bacterium]|nr:aminotransferase class III-fold pyridoxal phosphate-dependent enzyme [Chloroflexia bacterium]
MPITTEPAIDAQTVIAEETAAQLGTYAKLPIVAVRGAGIHLYDAAGRDYYDFYCGHAVTLTGHCHPQVVAAIQAQAAQLIFYSNIVYNAVRAGYAKALIAAAPAGYGQVFFCNSGAEANETALKLARKFTGRPAIIAMHEGFHGRTMGALTMTSNPKYKAGFAPLLPGVEFAPFGDLDALAAQMHAGVAAVILEPIQSIAGVRMAPASYYQGLRRLCDQWGALLIFDEIQTGLGRTGKLWAGEHWGVIPDLITLAKGLASGVPMGATLIAQRIAQTVHLDEHGSTFGGGPLACAAAAATLDVILGGDLPAHAAAIGTLLQAQLSPLPHVREVRGLGLLLGLVLDVPAKTVQQAALDQGIILGTSADPQVLRLMPPMVVTEADVAHLVAVLDSILRSLPA